MEGLIGCRRSNAPQTSLKINQLLNYLHMKTVYESEFWTIKLEEDTKIIRPSWFDVSSKMNADIYKKEMLKYTEMVETYKPYAALIDLRTMYFALNLELQEWTNTTCFPRILATGLRRVAIIMMSDFVAQLSIEQVMDENKGQEFQTKFFDDVDKAKAWILS